MDVAKARLEELGKFRKNHFLQSNSVSKKLRLDSLEI